MRAYGKNLRWIADRQYGDEVHTGIAMPASGKRPLKKSERQWAKIRIRQDLE